MIVLITISTPAIAVTIDFEELPYNHSQAGNVTPNPASLITDNFMSYGVIFGSDISAGVAVNRGFLAPSSGLNSVVGLDKNGQIPGTSKGAALGDISFSFVIPGTSMPAYTNDVSFTVGDIGGDTDIFDIRTYDIADVLIDVKHIESVYRIKVTISLPEIHRVEIDFTGDFGYSLDDLSFSGPAVTTSLPPVPFDLNAANSLIIQNFVKQFQTDPNYPHESQGFLTYVEKKGNLNGIDTNDIFYSAPGRNFSGIVSLIPIKNIKGKIIGYNTLSKDARPFTIEPDNPDGDILLELSIYSPEPNELHINSENYIQFYFANNAFKGKPVTIQQVSSDPNIEYPVWDIRNIISKNSSKLPLDYLLTDPNQAPADPNILVKVIEPNVPYAWFTLSTSREVIDINNDRIIDLNDQTFLLADLGKTGISRSDIASLKNNTIISGIPDGKVDEFDHLAFVIEYNKRNPADIIENPYGLFEDFESGQLHEAFVTSGRSTWIIDSDSYEGRFCAKSGVIGDKQNSILQVTVKCVTGQISFYRKVSSEGYDELKFYIDDAEKERWSGFWSWEKMTYQAAPGIHTLRWEYKKDWCTSEGQDAALIDDIVIQ